MLSFYLSFYQMFTGFFMQIGRTMLDIFTTPEIRKRFLLSSTILSSLSFRLV